MITLSNVTPIRKQENIVKAIPKSSVINLIHKNPIIILTIIDDILRGNLLNRNNFQENV